VDENLFYKGVDKTKVHGARLYQHHHITDQPQDISSSNGSENDVDSMEPPYPFDTGNTLLSLTKKHNVSYLPGLFLVF
jgi:hypothetical protein